MIFSVGTGREATRASYPYSRMYRRQKGYLSENAIVRIGSFLGMSTTKIYGLATFYDRFRFFPSGKVHMRICNGTTCFINGSDTVISAVREATGN